MGNPRRIRWARNVEWVKKYERQENRFGPNSDKMISLVRKKSVNVKIILNGALSNDG